MTRITPKDLLIRLDRVSRISTVFYMGLEGVGGIEMESDEDENVSIPTMSVMTC